MKPHLLAPNVQSLYTPRLAVSAAFPPAADCCYRCRYSGSDAVHDPCWPPTAQAPRDSPVDPTAGAEVSDPCKLKCHRHVYRRCTCSEDSRKLVLPFRSNSCTR